MSVIGITLWDDAVLAGCITKVAMLPQTQLIPRREFEGQQPTAASRAAKGCRRKFLRFFPGAFRDETYLDWERNYKWNAHVRWEAELNEAAFRSLLKARRYQEIGQHVARIESRTNLLFSFEKMAFRDAVKSEAGAAAFAAGLYEFLYGTGAHDRRFEAFCETIAGLPRKQTRVLTWPLVTVFGFIAQPQRHIFLKPKVTRIAAQEYGFEFPYQSRPNWDTYASYLEFAATVRRDLNDLHPRDMIDIQSFLWVQGSDEYEE
ncbi:MAG: hypothetical protein JOZ44_11575 [Acidobacteria bacterium]|nr:hypothetical protein [Acidobacteriota bacterium]